MTHSRLDAITPEIATGTRSNVEREALLLALLRMNRVTRISEIGTDSGVRKQPVGPAEIRKGSENRARIARMARPQAIGLGIESGIQITMDYAEREIIAVHDLTLVTAISSDGLRLTVSMSNLFQLPVECYRKAHDVGFDKVTVGEIISGMYGGPPDDPHKVISGGKISRVNLIASAIENALLNLRDS